MEKIEEIISLIDSHEKKESKNTFIKYLKRWPWFVVFCAIGAGLGYYKYSNSPNTYKVHSRILIVEEENSMSSLLSFDKPSMLMGKKTNIENQIGILRSYTLYRKALNNLNWETSWFLKRPLYYADLYKNNPFELTIPPNGINAKNLLLKIIAINNNEYSISASGETRLNGYLQEVEFNYVIPFGSPFTNEFFNFTIDKGNGQTGIEYYLNFNNLNTLTSHYLNKTNIALENIESDLISISIEGTTIQREVDFINELNSVFINFGVENKNISSENSVQFIESQLSRIKSSLSTAEENFTNYRKKNQVMNLGQEAQVIYSKLEEIEHEQYLNQLQIDYYTNLLQFLDNSSKIEEMVNPSVIGITDNSLSSMLSRLMDLYQRREVLSYSVQEKNPSLIVLEKEIKIARDGLDETLINQLEVTKSKKKSMEERYNAVQSRVKKLPETEKKLISIQREFDLNNELYTYMLQKKAEASISKASIAPQVQVIDEAMIESAAQTGPSMMKNVALGLIAFFMIPFGFITLLSLFNTKIEHREEVEKHSQIPVLEGIVKHKYKVKLPVIHHPRSGISESFRGLKSNVNAMIHTKGPRVISVNSLIPGEGKSFVSSNFSATLTKTNKKVLLVGADLHKPTLHNYLNIEEANGLSNYLKKELSYEQIIGKTSIPNLHFIQAGPIPHNPSDLLDSARFEELITQARNDFDYIIIDNAPLLLVPDAVLTSNFSDASLFILRMHYSHKEQIKQINKIVGFNRIERAAIVINEAPDRGYGYGNKYWKKGYGEYKHKMSIA